MGESNVLIIGAGISGLTTAWWLAEQGIKVEVWESAARVGGKIESTQEQGYLSESAAGLLVNFRPDIDRLIKRCNLAATKQHRPESLNRYVLHEGKLIPVPMTVRGIAKSPLWSRRGKLRMLAEGLIVGKGKADESVSQFVCRRFGREMLDTAIDPFVSGTLASDPDLAEAASILPRLKALESQYGSITRGMLINKLWQRRRINSADTFSFEGGMEQLVNAIATHPGIHIRQNTSVRQLEHNQYGWMARATSPFGEHQQQFSQLVMSTPADISAQLLSPLDPELSELLASIEYAPLAVLHMGFDQQKIQHSLDGTGFLVAKRDRLELNGNLWMSSLFPQRAPTGKALLTSYLGGARNPQQMALPEEKMIDQALAGLSHLLGLKGGPEYVRLIRHSRGLPLYHGAYQTKLRKINHLMMKHTGLHLCGNYLGGVSVRERIYQGRLMAKKVAELTTAENTSRHCSDDLSPLCTAQAHS